MLENVMVVDGLLDEPASGYGDVDSCRGDVGFGEQWFSVKLAGPAVLAELTRRRHHPVPQLARYSTAGRTSPARASRRADATPRARGCLPEELMDALARNAECVTDLLDRGS
ncbi:MAG TPA: hypothetical protein VIL73_08560, partial [Gaiellaceae bacterium]